MNDQFARFAGLAALSPFTVLRSPTTRVASLTKTYAKNDFRQTRTSPNTNSSRPPSKHVDVRCSVLICTRRHSSDPSYYRSFKVHQILCCSHLLFRSGSRVQETLFAVIGLINSGLCLLLK